MKILLTNDDGVYSPGILALYRTINEFGDVTIVAPYREQSGCSHSISILSPIRVENVTIQDGIKGYSVYGTPADCVKFSISMLFKKKPDIVVSGINQGANTGINVLYSGTVAGAREGAVFGIPSVAVSLTSKMYKNFDYASAFTAELIKNLHKQDIEKGLLLNVNIPKGTEDNIKGARITKQSRNLFFEKYETRLDPFNKEYHWLKGEKVYSDNSKWDDESVVRAGYVSITPLQCDQTAYDQIDKLQDFLTKIG